MTISKAIYRCEICGNIIAILASGQGNPVCCEKTMTLQMENTVDSSKEIHVPLIEKTPEGFKVTVGKALHPMEARHHVMFIELIADGVEYIQHLKLGSKPVAEFMIKANNVVVREYCNVHGLWESKYVETNNNKTA